MAFYFLFPWKVIKLQWTVDTLLGQESLLDSQCVFINTHILRVSGGLQFQLNFVSLLTLTAPHFVSVWIPKKDVAAWSLGIFSLCPLVLQTRRFRFKHDLPSQLPPLFPLLWATAASLCAKGLLHLLMHWAPAASAVWSSGFTHHSPIAAWLSTLFVQIKMPSLQTDPCCLLNNSCCSHPQSHPLELL